MLRRSLLWGVPGALALLLILAIPACGQHSAAAHELAGDSWLNTNGQPLTLASRRGKVTILHFWTFGCINCKHNLPIYARWQRQFASRGVQIIGVHTPETREERNPENVARRVKTLGITYPVLIDKDGVNWDRWNQRYWPTVYLIDKQGRVRYHWEGELNYGGANGELEMSYHIAELLAEK
jgi:thiol-disulfide isomerase/thioredoxin